MIGRDACLTAGVDRTIYSYAHITDYMLLEPERELDIVHKRAFAWQFDVSILGLEWRREASRHSAVAVVALVTQSRDRVDLTRSSRFRG